MAVTFEGFRKAAIAKSHKAQDSLDAQQREKSRVSRLPYDRDVSGDVLAYAQETWRGGAKMAGTARPYRPGNRKPR